MLVAGINLLVRLTGRDWTGDDPSVGKFTGGSLPPLGNARNGDEHVTAMR